MQEEKINDGSKLREILAIAGAILGGIFLFQMSGVVAGITNSDFLGKSSGVLGIIIGGVLGYYVIELMSFILVIVVVVAIISMFR